MARATKLENRVRKAIETQDPDRLRDLLRARAEIKEIKKRLGPQTKDELWEFFKEKYKIELVRVAVCPGHVSQLDFVWWIYRFRSVLAVFSRGYGKTSLVGLCEDANATFFPGYSSFTIGPGKDQGERKYKHLLPHVIEGGVIGGKELPHINRSIHSKTEYKNKSEIEIALGGGVDNANGPRSNRLHRDEIELMLDATRKQAANIPAGKKTLDGRYVPAHVVDTSTMKYAGGYVDLEMTEYLKVLEEAGVDPTKMDPIDAFELSVRRGCRPRKMLMISCVFEIAAENPTCSCVPDEQRRARLAELEMDVDLVCDCATYRSGFWNSDDPDVPAQPRTLQDVCQGRFARSRGYQEFEDIQTFFLDNDRDTWEAEKECSQPSREGAYLRSYSQDRHGIKGYEPDPENGPIFTSTDWGSTDEHWTGWFQELTRQVTVSSYKGEKIRTLPVGSKVLFAEHSRALLGNVENGRRVLEMEKVWVLRWPGWRVEERYHDNAGADAKKDWKEELGMDVVSRIRKDFAEEVKLVRTVVSGWAFYVDVPACPAANGAFKGWRQINGREIRNEHTHPMAGTRYYLHNRRVLERALVLAGGRPQPRPVAGEDHDARAAERVQRELGGPRVEREDPNYRPGRELVGVVGAEDSPLRSKSGSIERPLHRADRPR